MERQHGPTHDTLFLAITREASVYGVSVPLRAFLLITVTASAFFDFTVSYNLWWRLALTVLYVVCCFCAAAALSSWEPKWFSILSVWARTRLPALLTRWTFHFGGTTYRPWPSATHRSYAAMRDYAG